MGSTKSTNGVIDGHALIRFTDEDDIDGVNMLRESINMTRQRCLSTFRIFVMTLNDCSAD